MTLSEILQAVHQQNPVDDRELRLAIVAMDKIISRYLVNLLPLMDHGGVVGAHKFLWALARGSHGASAPVEETLFWGFSPSCM